MAQIIENPLARAYAAPAQPGLSSGYAPAAQRQQMGGQMGPAQTQGFGGYPGGGQQGQANNSSPMAPATWGGPAAGAFPYRAMIAPGYLPNVQSQQAQQDQYINQQQAAQNAWYAQLQQMPKYGPGAMASAPVQQTATQYQAQPSATVPVQMNRPGMPSPPNPMQAQQAMAPQQQQASFGRPPLAQHATAAPAPGSQLRPQPMQNGVAGGGSGLAMSDETKKVVDQRSLADEFLDHMKPYSYHYKDPSDEPREVPTGGKYLGVMAQDLEKVPEVGRQLVVDTPQGKMVDQKTALSAVMAGLARLNEKQQALQSDVLRRK